MELEKGKEYRLSGLWGAAKAYQVLKLCRETGRSAWVVTKGPKEQGAFLDDLKALGMEAALSFPSWEVLPHEETPPQREIVAERLDTLRRLELWRRSSEKKPVVVTTIQAVLFRVLSSNFLSSRKTLIRRGQTLAKNAFLEQLVNLGYEAFPMVGNRGDFSQRGGIVDFFPLNRDFPVRVEFFGNEVESLREFDVGTQRTVAELGEEEVEILFADEKKALLERRPQELALLTEHGAEDFLLVLDEKEELEEKARALEGLLPEKGILFCPWKEFLKKNSSATWAELSVLPRELASDKEKRLQVEARSVESALAPNLQNLRLTDLDLSHERVREMMEAIGRWLEEKFEVTLFCHNPGEQERLLELLKSQPGLPSLPAMKLGRLSAGFVLEKEKKVFLSDAEIFGRYKERRARWKFTGSWLEAPAAAPAVELEEGDYVVHVNYGIGRYRGLTKIPVEGVPKEMLEVEYADGARLYVPLADAHLVERYVGLFEREPELDKLGGLRWQATKLKVERAIRDYASELLEVQAERSLLHGFVYSKDRPWQKEFEDAFLFEETPDQAQAIEAVKRDMENPRPMDRLICGDVGYGKTEVAVRAAFKAVLDGRQVAVLVPTTVLAQQHGRTFSERLADYPVRVEVLSRFKTRAEQAKIVAALAAGEIDIVIGTHRLIQPDVRFKELGLVVIDEEQRFGVRHKEQLKKLRRLVDILTMTATPIPRTLYLSLVGVKEMSAIQTPPVDRLPIETHLLEFDEKVIRDAILREINREGQVFFVHNRVETIERMKEKIQRLVPEVRLDIAHGQMDEGELEMVMQAFVEGKLDVLVTTTIIESGLDIPNANTILIDRADRFGLAELYQLRGRVGRFKHQAYCYLLLPRDKVIVAEAKKRLKAMMEYASLGAGFKVAMKDLEIRGAGNILGEEQSGHIASIGFDLYCKLLKRTVERLKGKESELLKECAVRLGVEGELPASYISDLPQRLEMYRRIGEALSMEALEDLRGQMQDRFGPLPPETQRLLALSEIRILGAQKNLDSVELKENKLLLWRGSEVLTREGKLTRLYETQPDRLLAAVKKVLIELD